MYLDWKIQKSLGRGPRSYGGGRGLLSCSCHHHEILGVHAPLWGPRNSGPCVESCHVLVQHLYQHLKTAGYLDKGLKHLKAAGYLNKGLEHLKAA